MKGIYYVSADNIYLVKNKKRLEQNVNHFQVIELG